MGGDSLRRALAESFEHRQAYEEARLDVHDAASIYDSVDEDALREHGLPAENINRLARIETCEKSVSMLEAMRCA